MWPMTHGRTICSRKPTRRQWPPQSGSSAACCSGGSPLRRSAKRANHSTKTKISVVAAKQPSNMLSFAKLRHSSKTVGSLFLITTPDRRYSKFRNGLVRPKYIVTPMTRMSATTLAASHPRRQTSLVSASPPSVLSTSDRLQSSTSESASSLSSCPGAADREYLDRRAFSSFPPLCCRCGPTPWPRATSPRSSSGQQSDAWLAWLAWLGAVRDLDGVVFSPAWLRRSESRVGSTCARPWCLSASTSRDQARSTEVVQYTMKYQNPLVKLAPRTEWPGPGRFRKPTMIIRTIGFVKRKGAWFMSSFLNSSRRSGGTKAGRSITRMRLMNCSGGVIMLL
mmetsp:Transcript_12472/g.35362  ORF Transcript_12472/g.35362 Transcript_12472/m.35362 type:complete len:337 (-) Transcript_12472:683-1693(-)